VQPGRRLPRLKLSLTAIGAIQGLRDSGARGVFGCDYNEVSLDQPVFRKFEDRQSDMRHLREKLLSSDDALVTIAVVTSDLLIFRQPLRQVIWRDLAEYGDYVSRAVVALGLSLVAPQKKMKRSRLR
jgi:hypothetical protein